MEVLVEPPSISAESKKGSFFSFTGDGISVMLTGSETPLNQLASFPDLMSDLGCRDSWLLDGCSNSAASSGDTSSGEIDWSRVSLRNGRNVDDREGEFDRLKGVSEARSLVVLDR